MTESTIRGTTTNNAVPVVRAFRLAEAGPDDPRYEDLAVRGHNRRFMARPDAFRVVTSTEQVVQAVNDAVREERRVAIRSGAHGYENFAGDPSVEVVIDLAEMNAVDFDPERNAFVIEAGARLDDVYQRLYYGWGVTIPAGNSATVGIGGHVQGGGYGSLCRRHGITVDHLYAVEVVVVDASGQARAVVATRETDDPNHDLWWAHTGGGGGNFGVVTRYWFRSPSATGTDPTGLLPRPPASVLAGTVLFPRQGLDKAGFRTLLGNFGRWLEHNSGPESPYLDLFGGLVLTGRPREGDPGMVAVAFAHVDATRPDAAELLERYVHEITADLSTPPVVLPTERMPWLVSKRALAAAQDAEVGRQKVKSSYQRRPFTDQQADTLYEYLNSSDHTNDSSLVAIESFGGQANAVAADATAVAQRDSIMRVFFMNTWQNPEQDDTNLDWMRRLYRDLYAETGGVPAPGGNADGCFINFADFDMADPEWNASGVAWHDLYYKGNYARLQAVKTKWDPLNVFRHALSVRPSAK
ncbi:FAD-linked oxidase [Longimycelium tulufanense]|uniref:FAD-linked oxidase n=1 Tax=Longimycelium tulufanense TaxID=907463 RepID=A0A8J3C9S2_9PSEU|nr:FAD-binding protein [Longimycelium tulufanense]GGM33405.1 FAD-linked oxidase [Longimycelium tulufanense]